MTDTNTTKIADIISRWDAGDGKPYKGSLIDWRSYEADPENMGCMCAQGQVLHAVGGWDHTKLRSTAQPEADAETAKLLNISRAHSVLLRKINDKVDGAPSIVLTDPGKVLGDQWSKLLDFWWLFHNYTAEDWRKVAAPLPALADAEDVAWGAAVAAAWRDVAWNAAWNAARDAAWGAARSTVRRSAMARFRGSSAWGAAWATEKAAWGAAWDAVMATGTAAGDAAREIQGYDLLVERGRKPFFLPMFGFATPADIPARPDDYGLGVVPTGEA